jgi:hypothetical protein
MFGQGSNPFAVRQRARQPPTAGLKHQRRVIGTFGPPSDMRAERSRPKTLAGDFDDPLRAEAIGGRGR